jgi:rubrerythrin
MSKKPSYLGLLNGISLAETRAYHYLNAWIATTPNPDVRCVLQTVAAREGEHGLAFAKRINELGFELRQKEDPNFDKAMAIASSDRSDLKKFEKLGLADLEDRVGSIFDDFFKDHSIDIRTGELLGRYIAEEHDSGRLLRSCYAQLKEQAGGHSVVGAGEQLAALDTKVDALCAAVEQLQQLVCEQAAGANGKNGRTKAKASSR